MLSIGKAPSNFKAGPTEGEMPAAKSDRMSPTEIAIPPNPRAGSTEGERPAAKSKGMSPTEVAIPPNSRVNSANGEKRICVFWLHKRHFAGDQSFDSYLLMPRQKRDEILTS